MRRSRAIEAAAERKHPRESDVMHSVLRKLVGADLRSIGRSNEVVADVVANPQLFRIVFGGLNSENAVVRARAADAIEKITVQHPEYLRPYKTQLIGPLASLDQKEVRWHLAQMLPRVQWNQSEWEKVLDILMSYLNDESSIVKTFAMQALADLAQESPELMPKVLLNLQELTAIGTPAMKARGRKLLATLERSGMRTSASRDARRWINRGHSIRLRGRIP